MRGWASVGCFSLAVMLSSSLASPLAAQSTHPTIPRLESESGFAQRLLQTLESKGRVPPGTTEQWREAGREAARERSLDALLLASAQREGVPRSPPFFRDSLPLGEAFGISGRMRFRVGAATEAGATTRPLRFSVPRIRIRLDGRVPDSDWRWRVQFNPTGDEVAVDLAGERGLSETRFLELLDTWAEWRPKRLGLRLRVGAQRVPGSRQRMTGTAWTLFPERALSTRRVGVGRRTGLSLRWPQWGPFDLHIGLFSPAGSGDGDAVERPLLAARLQWLPCGGFPYREGFVAGASPSQMRLALGAAATHRRRSFEREESSFSVDLAFADDQRSLLLEAGYATEALGVAADQLRTRTLSAQLSQRLFERDELALRAVWAHRSHPAQRHEREFGVVYLRRSADGARQWQTELGYEGTRRRVDRRDRFFLRAELQLRF